MSIRVTLAVFAIGLGLASLTPPRAHADVVVNTFDTGDTFHPQFNLVAAAAIIHPIPPFTTTVIRAAVRFQVGCSAHTLDSIRLPLSQQNAVPQNFLRVRLAADSGGAPGATIETLSENLPMPQITNPFSTVTTFTSVAHPILEAATAYWIVTELTAIPAGNVDFRWFRSVSGTTSQFRQQQVTGGGLPADPWTGGTSSLPVAYRVEGTVVPVGACCNPDTGACAIVTSATCTALGMNPMPGATCATNPCPPGCRADFDRVDGRTVADIFAFLGAWFAGCP